MLPHGGLTLKITSLKDQYIMVGNKILEGIETEYVHFRTLAELKAAMLLDQKGDIRILDSIPQDILDMVNAPPGSSPAPPPEPGSPGSLFYRDEFMRFKAELDELLKQVDGELAQKLNNDDVLSMANLGQDIKEAMTGGSVPVVGVESTGLINLSKDIQEGISSWKEQSLTFVNGYFNPNNGQIINDSPEGKRTTVSVNEGERYKYTGVTGVITVGLFFSDANGNFLSKAFAEHTTETNLVEREIVVPKNAVTMSFSNYARNNTRLWKLTTDFNKFAKATEIVKIPEHENKIKTLYSSSDLNYRNMLNWSIGDITNGSYQSSTTRIRTDVTKAPSDIIVKVPWYSVYVYCWTFENENRENASFKMYQEDFIIPKGTWFALVFRYATEGSTVSNPLTNALYLNTILLPMESPEIGSNLKVTAHRGYSMPAPENTLPAIIWAKKVGFDRAEVDIDFTSDGACVCIHDETINRTSNGTGTVRQMTLEQIKTYDFGAWKHPRFSGTKIPTLEEVLECCKKIGLELYIDMNAPNMTDDQITTVVNLVKKYRMMKSVSYIGARGKLEKVLLTDPTARLGFIYYSGGKPLDDIENIASFKTDQNEIFLNVSYDTLSESLSLACMEYGFDLEAWTINFPSILENNYKFLDGYATDGLLPWEVFKSKYY